MAESRGKTDEVIDPIALFECKPDPSFFKKTFARVWSLFSAKTILNQV